MAKASLIFEDKTSLLDGAVIEMRIWRLPEAVPERPHGLIYSLYFGRNGVRLVGYDNERGKGDHRYCREIEQNYHFTTVEQLMNDFLHDVKQFEVNDE